MIGKDTILGIAIIILIVGVSVMIANRMQNEDDDKGKKLLEKLTLNSSCRRVAISDTSRPTVTFNCGGELIKIEVSDFILKKLIDPL